MNTDNANIVDAFEGVAADFGAVHGQTGAAMVEDWGRRIDTGDPYSGIIGAYSAVLDITGIGEATPVLRLLSSNFAGVSPALIAGKRKYFTGTKTFDLSTLSLSGGNHTVYVGVKDDGEALATIDVSDTLSLVQVPLYSVPINLTGSTYTLLSGRAPSRIDRSLLWDNTVEQLRQETPQVIVLDYTYLVSITSPIGTVNSTTDAAYTGKRFKIPYDHYWSGISLEYSAVDASHSSTWTVSTVSPSDTVAEAFFISGSYSSALNADYSDKSVVAANTVYTVAINSTSSQTVTKPTLNLFVNRAYNAPTH
jgi:hypothetical protein